jgi:hypothetical protein
MKNAIAFLSEVDTGSREKNASRLAVIELVEVAHRLRDRLEMRSRIERVNRCREAVSPLVAIRARPARRPGPNPARMTS